jgi:hypothetical protein
MKKEHRLFLIQIVIAVVVFVLMSLGVKSIFMNDPKAESYLDFNEGVKKMASSSYALIDSLIARNDLTFDPTSGKSLDKVLSNLKYSENAKFLVIGSSQMRVMQGEEIQDSYHKMTSRKIADYTNGKYTSYNLSLGGMTTPEKLIMARKGIKILNPDRILIAVTPWDGLAVKIRPEVKAIEKKTFQSLKKITSEEEKEEATLSTESDEVFPINVNSKITKSVDKIVEDNIDIYAKRSAIKKWLGDKTLNTLKGIKDGASEKEEEAFKTNITDYWRTINQDLNNIEGWESEVAHAGKRSIKIVNGKVQNAKWTGDGIIIKKPTDTFEFEGWSKAEDIQSSAKLYCLDFQVFFEDGTYKWYYKNLRFKKETHDWQKVKTRVRFDKKVVSIKPHALLYGTTGTVWFDDVTAKPVYDNVVAENVLPNSGFENELKERANVSYMYSNAEWGRIEENMFSIVDYLASQKTNEQNVFLLTPFWHTKDRTAYPQKTQYTNLVKAVKNYCKEKNIAFVDASYILKKENFGIYKKGSIRDKIDVLHFNADAHDKLAKYIIKELKL